MLVFKEDESTLFNENLQRSVEELELSVRSANCLKKRRDQQDLAARSENRKRNAQNKELWP